MSRLSGYQRDGIVRRAVEDIIDPEKERLKGVENDLTHRVLVEIAEVHGLANVYKAAKSLPSGWVTTTGSLHVKAAGVLVELSAYGVGGRHRTLLPNVLGLLNSSTIFDRGNPLTQEILKLDEDRKALRARKEAIETRVRALVGQVSTLPKLMFLWPEGEPYWAPLRDKKPSTMLPTVKVDEVNKLLGLPKDARNAA